MLKYLACLLIISQLVSSEPLQKTSQVCLKERESLPETCHLNERITRSIKTPITDIFNTLLKGTKTTSKENNENTIECDNDLLINIVQATITNSDKTKCSQVKTEETTSETCNDRILTTILATKLCNGKNKCDLSVDKNFGMICECSTQKYLDISYKCMPETEEEENKRSKRYIRLNYQIPGVGYGPGEGYGHGENYGYGDNYDDYDYGYEDNMGPRKGRRGGRNYNRVDNYGDNSEFKKYGHGKNGGNNYNLRRNKYSMTNREQKNTYSGPRSQHNQGDYEDESMPYRSGRGKRYIRMNYNIDEGSYGAGYGYGGEVGYGGDEYSPKRARGRNGRPNKEQYAEGAANGYPNVRMGKPKRKQNVEAAENGGPRVRMDGANRRQNVEAGRNGGQRVRDNRRARNGRKQQQQQQPQQGPAEAPEMAATLKATSEENLASVENHSRSKRYIRLNYNIDEGGYGGAYGASYGGEGGYGGESGYGGNDYAPKRGRRKNNNRQGEDNYGGGYGDDEYKPNNGGKRNKKYGTNSYGSDNYGADNYGSEEYKPKRGGKRNMKYGADSYGSDNYGAGNYGSEEYKPKRGGKRNMKYGADSYGSDNYGAGNYGVDSYGSDSYGANNYDDSMPKRGRYGRKGYNVSMGGPGQKAEGAISGNAKSRESKKIVSPSGRASMEGKGRQKVNMGNQGGRRNGGRRQQNGVVPNVDEVSTLSFKEALEQAKNDEKLTKLSTGNTRFLGRFLRA